MPRAHCSRPPRPWGLVLVVPLVLVAGCGGPRADDAAAVARDFVATASSDAGHACALLAPATVQELEQTADARCDEALPEEGVSPVHTVTGVEVAGQSAQVSFGRHVVFLARFDNGWRVTAAGCTKDAADPTDHEKPYDCDISGG